MNGLKEDEIYDILIDLVGAIGALHLRECPLAHRDIKVRLFPINSLKVRKHSQRQKW